MTYIPLSDTAYDATSWDGVTTVAPSKNAVRDKFETLVSQNRTLTINGTALDLSADRSWTVAGSSSIRRLFTVAGTIGATGTNVANTWVSDGTYTISQVNMWLGTAGNGTLTVDINKNGTTLFTTTKPSITGTNQSSINTGTLTTTSLASGDVLTLDINAFQATTQGVDLYVELIYA